MKEIQLELIDELLKGSQKSKEITGQGGLLRWLTKTILECAAPRPINPAVRASFNEVEKDAPQVRGIGGNKMDEKTKPYRISKSGRFQPGYNSNQLYSYKKR
jgi:hypothetical protein